MIGFLAAAEKAYFISPIGRLNIIAVLHYK